MKNKSRRILHEPVWGTPRHVGRHFRAKNRRSDLPVFNIKQDLAKKLDPTLKRTRLKEITYLTHFYAQKSKCPRRFWEIDPIILHTFSTRPSPGLTSVFVFFPRKYIKGGPHFPKNLNWRKPGKKRKTTGKVFPTAHRRRAKIHGIKKMMWTLAGD